MAYADFVTAMMALFMVLWICSQDKEVLVATSRYFQQPFASPMPASGGILNMDAAKPTTSSGKNNSEDAGQSGSSQTDAREVDLHFLNAMAKDFYRLLHLDEDLQDKPIDIQVTTDGLRVTLFDRARKPIFSENGFEFTEWGRFVMQSLAWTIDRHHFYVVIEGHTRSGLEFPTAEYSAWELSADRANAARRALTYYAVDPKYIERVTGFADTRLVAGESPTSESNQRVTLSLSVGRREEKEKSKPKPAAASTAPAPAATTSPNTTKK